MITPTMNKIDINNNIIKAEEHYALKLKNMQDYLNKKCKHYPKADACKVEAVEWKQEHQKYLAIASRVYGMGAPEMAAIVDHGSQIWIYDKLSDLSDTMDAYSMHFYKRYAERTNQLYLFPTIVGKYRIRNKHRFKMYENKENGDTAYATTEGVELCRWDKERGITKFCTFISHAMLKENQKEAWNVVRHKIDEADAINNSNASLKQKYILMSQWSDSSPDVTELATSVYKQYYDELQN